MTEFTDWFGPDIQPDRSAVYPTEMIESGQRGYSRWVGGRWGSQYFSPEIAAIDGTEGSQNKRWRGLASDPAKGANHD